MPAKNNNATNTDEQGGFSAWLKAKTEEEFKQLYPLTHALVEAWDSVERPLLRIVSEIGGFRRGGIAHVRGAATHDLSNLTPDQVEQILAEPTLTADLVPAPEVQAEEKPATPSA